MYSSLMSTATCVTTPIYMFINRTSDGVDQFLEAALYGQVRESGRGIQMYASDLLACRTLRKTLSRLQPSSVMMEVRNRSMDGKIFSSSRLLLMLILRFIWPCVDYLACICVCECMVIILAHAQTE